MKISALKKRLLTQIVLRASSGLHYIEDELRHRSGGTDASHSRSRYILMSYNTDLILNAMLVLSEQSETEEEIFKNLMKIGSKHNYEKMFFHINSEVREHCGLKSVARKVKSAGSNQFTEYTILNTEGELAVVQDFIEVRYDFKKVHGKNEGRPGNPNETTEMKKQIQTLQKLVRKLESLL